MKQSTLAIATLLVVGLLGVSLVSANTGFGLSEEERTALQEERQLQREAIRNAISEGDYATWEGLMHEKLAQMEERITPETFEELQERQKNREAFREAVQELRESGELDREKLKELKEEYNVDIKDKKNFGKARAYHKGFKQGTTFGHSLHE